MKTWADQWLIKFSVEKLKSMFDIKVMQMINLFLILTI